MFNGIPFRTTQGVVETVKALYESGAFSKEDILSTYHVPIEWNALDTKSDREAQNEKNSTVRYLTGEWVYNLEAIQAKTSEVLKSYPNATVTGIIGKTDKDTNKFSFYLNLRANGKDVQQFVFEGNNPNISDTQEVTLPYTDVANITK